MTAEKRVTRYDCGYGNAQFCQGCYQMEQSDYGDYVKHEDYEAKERLVKSVRRWVQLWRTNDIDSSSAMRQIAIDLDTARVSP